MKIQLKVKTLGIIIAATLILSINLHAEPSVDMEPFLQQVTQHIRGQLTQESTFQNLVCQGEQICGLKLMPLFYQEREYAPVWFDANGLRPAARTLIASIKNADKDGLHPADYHTTIINLLLSDYDFWPLNDDAHQAAIRADLDLLLTDAFLLFGTHLANGRIDPETLHTDWILPEESIDVMNVLHNLSADTDMVKIIDQFRPHHAGYVQLRRALVQMRQLQAQGDIQAIKMDVTLKPGVKNKRIPLLRQRLHRLGDLDNARPQSHENHYDPWLSDAVKKFQHRHGLAPDGVIGEQTLEALNVTADQRVRQIELNLERWRWLPKDLHRRHIVVNTADFNLRVIENQEQVLQMPVVVGRPARRTPVFSAPISYLVLNPYWTVPHKLAVEDILPKLTKGTEYLAKQGFEVFKGWGEKAEAVNPEGINWKIYGKNYFPFRLRQNPGPRNALGRVKFMMPNKFSIYLHDTPQRAHFKEIQRDFSSGCIRVQDARLLAHYLLANEPAWSPETIDTYLSTGKRQVVKLSDPIPVHLLYMTAWMDETGTLQFRNDIYDRDHDLDLALARRQPAPLPLLNASEVSAISN